MPTVAAVAKLKAHLSKFLDFVKAGDEIVVTERGNPIARIVPFTDTASGDERIRALARAGLIRLGMKAIPDSCWTTEGPADPEGRSLAHLLAERAEGR
jgi:prevent-host-death family protein